MKPDLSPYSNKRICVAVSGGKDSMALLHYLAAHAKEYGIVLSALNCDHGIRGEASARDSAFVKAYCGGNGIKLYFFEAEKGALTSEKSARQWRLDCYKKVLDTGCVDCIATAHHMNDNAETVLLNLARGTYLSGLKGIVDRGAVIRPLIGCTRAEIDAYAEQNGLEFVTDESNLTDDYTRNKLRHNVLPALEETVDGAVKNIYRFSRLAAEDEEYFARAASEFLTCRDGVAFIRDCPERVIFKRAAHSAVAGYFDKIDYTAEHFERLFELQEAECGKRFEFLHLTAVKERGGIAVSSGGARCGEEKALDFSDIFFGVTDGYFCGELAVAVREERRGETIKALGIDAGQLKILRFDIDKIPQGAVVRFRRDGDKFTKFGGGSKSLGDYLTDKKIPQSLRGRLPLICLNGEVYAVGGVEISDKIRIDEGTRNPGVFICCDPTKRL